MYPRQPTADNEPRGARAHRARQPAPAPADGSGNELRLPPDGRAAGPLDSRGPAPMTPQMRSGQRRPLREGPALLALLITAAVLAGCASPATAGRVPRPRDRGPQRPARPPRPASSPPGTTATPRRCPRAGPPAGRPHGSGTARAPPAPRTASSTSSPGPAGSRPGRWRHQRGTAWRLTPQRPSGPPPPPTRARQSRNPARRSRSAANPPGCWACNARQAAASWWRPRSPSTLGPLSCSHPKTRQGPPPTTALTPPRFSFSSAASGFRGEGYPAAATAKGEGNGARTRSQGRAGRWQITLIAAGPRCPPPSWR